MRKRRLVALIVGLAAIFVIAGLYVYLMGLGSSDYFPPGGVLKAERTADNIVTFTIENEVYGVDGPVKFDNCALNLRIDDQDLGPTDYPIGSSGWQVRTTHGEGLLNAIVFTDESSNYIIVLNDVDSDGNVSKGDTISLIATEPLKPSTTYSIFFFTELRSSWSFGEFTGGYSA
jgi:hypothetical protein